MSGLHLAHKISWTNLAEFFTTYKDPGIELPIGECGRIHQSSRKSQIQVEHRRYLSDQVCTDTECEEKGSKVFRKNDKSKLTLSGRNSRINHNSKSFNNFIDSFSSAIREFAKTERKKVIHRKVVLTKDFRQHVIDKLEEDTRLKMDYGCCYSGLCQVFTALIEIGDTATLLSFTDEQIRSVLSCQHGGQAVGNNIRFLWYHVFRVYLYTNIIAACGLHDKPEEWGSMKPDNYFRRTLDYDCDGQTFLQLSRIFITSDVYMKDWQAMKQLCKNCFQFLYFVEMLREEVYDSWTEVDLKSEIEYF